MPVCAECGKKVPDDAAYCPYCGFRLGNTLKEEFTISSEDLVKKVKELIHEGNVRRITVKDEEGKTMLDLPISVGIIGILIAPMLAAVGAVAAIVTKCTIEIERREDKSSIS